MQIEFCCTHWGCETKSPVDFLGAVVRDGFSGVEINLGPDLQNDGDFQNALAELRDDGFVFIAQQVLENKLETPREHTRRMLERLEELSRFTPDFINSHTGKDHFSFDENCRIIEAAENFAVKSGISVCHETHRARFSFHLAGMMRYLEKFPEMKLTADFSHWCNVSESMLEDQTDLLKKVMPHVKHIHARVGWEQSAQVGDPFAPEWEQHLATFTTWWKATIDQQKKADRITVTPEVGPFPYMPQLPYSRQDVAPQWQLNLKMKQYLREQFCTHTQLS